MVNYNNSGYGHNQRKSVLASLIDADGRVARAQYRFLRSLPQPVTLMGMGRTSPLLWSFVRDFERGRYTLYYSRDGGWEPVPIDDCTQGSVIDGLLCTSVAELRPIALSLRRVVGTEGDALGLDWREVCRSRGCHVVISMASSNHLGGVDRSRLICSMASKLYARGASVVEVAFVIAASTAFKAKFGGGRRTAIAEAENLHKWWREKGNEY